MNRVSRLQVQLCAAAIISLTLGGIISCWLISQADVWWHQFGCYSTPAAARFINQFEQPLIVSDALESHVLSLSHMLKVNPRFQLVREPNIPKISLGFRDVFLFRSSRWLINELGKEYQVKLVEKSGNIFRITEFMK